MQAYHLGARVRVAADGDDLTRVAVREIGDFLHRRLARQRTVSVALSGGGTPGPVYAGLAAPPYRHLIDWPRVRLFWVDERCVRPNDPDSNYRLVDERLIQRLARRPAVYRMPGELPPLRGAEAYRWRLGEAFGPGVPVFDLIVLGMGGDAHTASLFPGSAALASRRTVLTSRGPAPPHERLTLGLSVLNAARKVVFLVQGSAKADVLAAVLASRAKGGTDPRFPAALVRPPTPPTWIVDRAAAAGLD